MSGWGRGVGRRIPHACGGEPRGPVREYRYGGVFPTRVGVNRMYRKVEGIVLTVFPTRVGVNRAHAIARYPGWWYSPRVWG